MKTLYLDIFSGLSGDMMVGALLDLGVDFHRLEHELEELGLEGFHLHVWRGERAHIAGTKFDVHLGHEHHEHHEHQHRHGHQHQAHQHQAERLHGDEPEEHAHAHGPTGEDHDHDEREAARTFADIRELIHRSALSDWVKQKAVAVFQRVAVAEGKIHGQKPEEVHFHEVGAVDSIIDIVGSCLALDWLGRPRVLAGPVVEGSGWIQCAHGRFPLPAPATLEILAARRIPISQCDEPQELLTPTGAALLAELAESFGPMQGLIPIRVGYGLGTRDNRTRPNVLRAVLCESGGAVSGHDWDTDTVAVLQTNLDDTNAELLGGFVEKALAQGALDVFHTPIHMKKSRPGVLLSLLCPESEADRFSELILRETTAFGVRRHLTERRKLRREFTTVRTPYGEVILKLGKLDGQIVQAAPEYESCQRLAEQAGTTLKQVYDAVHRAIPL